MIFDGPNAGTDHAHFADYWFFPDPEQLPINAAAWLQTNAAGGKQASWDARSNYAFLDGRVETLEFAMVYRDATENAFDPDIDRPFSP